MSKYPLKRLSVYLTLQIPLKKASRDVIFVNTSPPDERTVMIKNFTILKTLPDDSDDVTFLSVLDHYSARPSTLDDVCLAAYVSWYRRIPSKTSNTKVVHCVGGDSDKDVDEQLSVDENSEENQQYQHDGGYVFKRRSTQVVLRYVRYTYEKDKENHCREALLLFHPWREESELMGGYTTYQEKYQHLLETTTDFEMKMQEYNHSSASFDKAMEDIEVSEESDLEDQWDKVAPNAQCTEREDEETGTKPSDLYPSYAPVNEADLDHSDLALQEMLTHWMSYAT